MIDYLPFIIFLMILAVFLRAESALTVIYMIMGSFFLAFWWNKRALQHIEVTREFQKYAFSGDHIPVELVIKNNSILPILWLEMNESLSVDLRGGKTVKQVFSLGPREKKVIRYDLHPNKRGYYNLGPLRLSTGDPLGVLEPTQKEIASHPLTVYPQIINMAGFRLPSRSPFGTIKHRDPIFEDPSRILGKRDFQNGDPIRRIDWKSTAATGQLQVKLYEASIALQVAILLDLHLQSYELKTFIYASELSIIAAASVAAWGQTHQQTVGLVTNGADPRNDHNVPNPIPPKKGTGHFIQILEVLARIQTSEVKTIENLAQDALARLSWGTTVVLISGGVQETTLSQLNQARKKGINPTIILTGQSPAARTITDLSAFYQIPLYKVHNPQDLRTMGIH
ncbi:MAG: DUF58 domain-containing protein [Brevefilum sp.]